VAKKKIFTWVGIAVGVLVLAVVLFVFFGLDSILRSKIQANATESLKLRTVLNSAKLSFLHGTLDLKGLAIESPQGFGSDVLFAMAGAKTDVSYGELRGDPIKIDQIVITKPSLVIEFSLKEKKLNLQALTENLKSSPSDPNKEPVHLIIKNLRIEQPEVVIWPGIPGFPKQDDVVVKLPTIDMKDIGSGPDAKNGAAIKDVAMQVIAAMTAKAADSDQLPPAVRAMLAMNADELGKALGAEFDKQLQGLSQSVQQKLGEQLKDKLPGNLGENVGKDAGKAVEGGLKDLAGSLQKKPATKPGP